MTITVYGSPAPHGSGRFMPTHGGFGTPEYNAWRAMIKRCYLPTNPSFQNYAGRGISVCKEWRESFANFMRDMGKRPSAEYSLGRIDNDLGYCQENCRWETRRQQQSNRRSVPLIAMEGESLPLTHWCERKNIDRGTVRARLRRGWTIERALNTPADERHSSR